MPAINNVDPTWDLADLIAIHGLLTDQDPEWATEGIALDLGLSVLETRALLRAHGVTEEQLNGKKYE